MGGVISVPARTFAAYLLFCDYDGGFVETLVLDFLPNKLLADHVTQYMSMASWECKFFFVLCSVSSSHHWMSKAECEALLPIWDTSRTPALEIGRRLLPAQTESC